MGYTDKLIRLLKPLGIYDLRNGAGAAELRALGGALDGVGDITGETARECVVSTAESWGLSRYEELFPQIPAWSDTETRRMAIASLLTLNDASFTLAGVNAAISGCGITAHADEASAPETVAITFPGTRGEPEEYDRIKSIIGSIVPCHLDIVYSLAFATWGEIDALELTWAQVDGMTWKNFEKLG